MQLSINFIDWPSDKSASLYDVLDIGLTKPLLASPGIGTCIVNILLLYICSVVKCTTQG